MHRLLHRLWIGVVAGIALTVALDIFRFRGFMLGYLPSDMPLLFGKEILGLGPGAEPTTPAYVLGYGYHFLNGIGFGVVFSLLFGKTPWYVAVLYSVVFVELGMMTLPPMAKMLGPFGIERYGTIWNGMFITTLVAHIGMGVAPGLIVQTWGRYKGLLFREGSTAEQSDLDASERSAHLPR